MTDTHRVDASASPSEHRSEATHDDSLIDRLRVIEDQPLDDRAAAYARIHDELQSVVEGDPTRG